MPLLTIRHVTIYPLSMAGAPGDHRAMMRPRDAFGQLMLSRFCYIHPLSILVSPTD